jgi:hypothetical protein
VDLAVTVNLEIVVNLAILVISAYCLGRDYLAEKTGHSRGFKCLRTMAWYVQNRRKQMRSGPILGCLARFSKGPEPKMPPLWRTSH